MWMLAKVRGNNNFSGKQGRMGGNEMRCFCYMCHLVRLTTGRGKTLLKLSEKISVGRGAQCYTSFRLA